MAGLAGLACLVFHYIHSIFHGRMSIKCLGLESGKPGLISVIVWGATNGSEDGHEREMFPDVVELVHKGPFTEKALIRNIVDGLVRQVGMTRLGLLAGRANHGWLGLAWLGGLAWLAWLA